MFFYFLGSQSEKKPTKELGKNITKADNKHQAGTIQIGGVGRQAKDAVEKEPENAPNASNT
ncbi:hypothetical protein FACS1894103_0220 [Campylobacterota bacterium]|nr:hypothetical protein FACS1894103_0220 [Campylobacterota bacterium]